MLATNRRPSGHRRCRVTIEQRPAADAVDASYTPVDGPWTTLAKEWMAQETVGGEEQFRARQMSASYDTRWHMTYRKDMDPNLVNVPKLRRLVYSGRVYDVLVATMNGRRDGIELTTLAKVG